MKLVILIDNLGSGGAQRQVYLLASQLATKKMDLSVVTYHQYTRDFYGSLLEQLGVKIVKLNEPGYIRRFWAVRCVIANEKPNVVLSFLYGANMLACLLKCTMPRGFRLIVSDRTGLVNVTRADWWRYNLYRIADAMIVNSSDTLNKVLRYAPWLSNRIKLIWNMVEVERFQSSEDLSVTTRYDAFEILVGASFQKLKNPQNFILGVGRFVEKYGIPVSRIQIIWHGNKLLPNNREFMNELQRTVVASGLEGSVYLFDETEDLGVKIMKADFCALPSFYEGCPNFIIEAMSLGKPVLVSDVCSNRDIVDENLGGFFFNPFDVGSIADALYQAYCTTPSMRAEMGSHNYHKARMMFSIEEKVGEYLELFTI